MVSRLAAGDAAEKITVAVDVRGGGGWSNPSPTSLVPFVRVLSAVLSANFPERLRRMVIFPVPWAAKAVWCERPRANLPALAAGYACPWMTSSTTRNSKPWMRTWRS